MVIFLKESLLLSVTLQYLIIRPYNQSLFILPCMGIWPSRTPTEDALHELPLSVPLLMLFLSILCAFSSHSPHLPISRRAMASPGALYALRSLLWGQEISALHHSQLSQKQSVTQKTAVEKSRCGMMNGRKQVKSTA